jgi:ribosomal protein S18 acetylase RimI-like enzyme
VSDVRIATVSDIDEIIRLRALLLESVDDVEIPLGPWVEDTSATMRDRLSSADPTFVAFVIDQPDQPEHRGRLASCVVGLIETRLGSPENPSGRFGYILNVCTDAAYRRRGYARACMESLLDWYAARDVPKIDLKATDEGEPLYRSLGFVPTPSAMLRYSAS